MWIIKINFCNNVKVFKVKFNLMHFFFIINLKNFKLLISILISLKQILLTLNILKEEKKQRKKINRKKTLIRKTIINLPFCNIVIISFIYDYIYKFYLWLYI